MSDLYQLVVRTEQLLVRYQELEKKYSLVCNELSVSQSQCAVLHHKIGQAQVRIRNLLENLPESSTPNTIITHETY